MSLTATKNTNITRTLSATVEGKKKSVAMLTGHVTPGKAMTFSLVISDESLAAANHADVAAALDDFITELRTMAAASMEPTHDPS